MTDPIYYADQDTVESLTGIIKAGLNDDTTYDNWLEIALFFAQNKINSALGAAMIPIDSVNNPNLTTNEFIQAAANSYATSFMYNKYYGDEDNSSSTAKLDYVDADTFVSNYIIQWFKRDENSGYSRRQTNRKVFRSCEHRRRIRYGVNNTLRDPEDMEW